MAKKPRKPSIEEVRKTLELLACGACGQPIIEVDEENLAWLMNVERWAIWLAAIRATYFEKHTSEGTIVKPIHDYDYVFALWNLHQFRTYETATEFIREQLPVEFPAEET